MNHPSYGDESFAQDIPHPDVLAASIPTDMAGVGYDDFNLDSSDVVNYPI